MPDFPRYSSQRSLTTQQPRALRDDADIHTEAAERTKIATGAISDVSDTLVKWNAAVEKIQADTAMYNFRAGMQEIYTDASLDSDINAESKYQQRRADLQESVVKGIDNQGLINRITPELNYLSNLGSMEIQTAFRKKIILHGQKIVLDDLTLLANNPTDLSEDAIKNRITEAVTDGLYSEVEGFKLQKEYLSDMQQNRFRQDARLDREQAKKNLESGKYNFDQKQTDTALSTLEHYKNLENKDETQRIVNGRFDLFTAIAEGKEDLYNLSATAQKFVNSDVDTAEAISKAQKATAGYYTSKKDRSYVTTIREASEATSQEKLTNIMYSALYRDKDITPEKLGALAYYCSERAKTLKLSKTDVSWADIQANPKQAKTDLCLNALSDWAKNNDISKDMHSDLISEFINDVAEGQEPLPVYQDIVKRENLKLFPDMANLPEKGQVVVDKNGVAMIAFPDGTLKPIEPKATKLPEGDMAQEEEKRDETGLPSFDEANK